MFMLNVDGPQFTGSVIGNKVWSNMNSVVDINPPVKMREIMHYDLYISQNGRSSYNLNTKSWSDLIDSLGYITLEKGAFGELFISIMFRQYKDPAYANIADGIVTDYYIISSRESGTSMFFGWYTSWTDTSSAKLFIKNYHKLIEQKYSTSVIDSIDSTLYFSKAPIPIYLERMGTDVIVVEKYPSSEIINKMKLTTKSALSAGNPKRAFKRPAGKVKTNYFDIMGPKNDGRGPWNSLLSHSR